MSRFDLLNGKKPPKAKDISKHTAIYQEDNNSPVEGIKSLQTSPGRSLIIRGPGGYSVIVPLRTLSVEMSDNDNKGNCLFQLHLPSAQAHALWSDIETARSTSGNITRLQHPDEAEISITPITRYPL